MLQVGMFEWSSVYGYLLVRDVFISRLIDVDNGLTQTASQHKQLSIGAFTYGRILVSY